MANIDERAEKQAERQAESDIINILIYGDIHLSSKDYGSHKDYPQESLGYFKRITERAREINAKYIIGLGDLTYGRFNSLEYRDEVDNELRKQNEICNGNRYEIKGNHDRATYGMTEYEYYLKKGLIKKATNLQIGNLNLSMVDYKQHMSTEILKPEKDKVNMVLMHDYFKFSDTRMPNYGTSIELDNFEKWYGVDYIIGGHIHNTEVFEGWITSDGMTHKTAVAYLGCPSRPAYREGAMQSEGTFAIVQIKNGKAGVYFDKFPLLALEESFNLVQMEEQQEREEKKKVDISDIVNGLESHQRVIGEPQDVVMAMTDVDIKYRLKAVELLNNIG